MVVFYFIAGLLIIITLLYALISKSSPQIYFVPAFDYPVILLLLTLFLSTIFSVNPEISFFGPYIRQIGLLTYFYLIIIYFLSPVIINEDKIKSVTNLFKFLGFIISIYCFLQFGGMDYLNFQPLNSHRPVTTIGSPVFTAGFLLLIFPFVLFDALNKKLSSVDIILALVIFAAIVITQTRTAYIGVFLEIAVIVIAKYYFNIRIPKKKFLFRLLLVSVIIISLVVILMLFFSSNVYVKRLISISQFSSSARFSTWNDCIHIIKAFPLFGTGINCFAYVTDDFISSSTKNFEILKVLDNAHSNYLQIACTMGLLGLAAHLILLGQYIRFSFKNFISFQRESKKKYLLPLFTSGIGYLIYSIADFDDITILLYFFTLLILLRTSLKDKLKLKQFKFNKLIAVYLLIVFTLGIIWNSIDNIQKYIADKHFREGRILYNKGHFKESVENINAAINNNFRCPEYKYTLAYFIYSYCLKMENINKEAEIKLLSQAKDEVKRCEVNYYSKLKTKALTSLIDYELGNIPEADKLRDEVLAKDTMMVDYSQELVKQMFKQQKYPEMIKYLETAYRYDMHSDKLLEDIILNLKNSNRNDFAIQCCELAMRIRPNKKFEMHLYELKKLP